MSSREAMFNVYIGPPEGGVQVDIEGCGAWERGLNWSAQKWRGSRWCIINNSEEWERLLGLGCAERGGGVVTWWACSATRLPGPEARRRAYPRSDPEGGGGKGWVGWAGEGEEPDWAPLDPALSPSSAIGQLRCPSGARLHR